MLLERRAEAERLRESIRVGVSTCTCVLVSYKKYCILVLLERRVEAERLRESIRVGRAELQSVEWVPRPVGT